MKRLTFAMIGAMLAAVAYAVPAIPTPLTIAQSDGSTITVHLNGDEWQHCFTTTDGLTIERDRSGDFFYRTPDGITAVRAHAQAQRNTAEQAFIRNNADKLTIQAVMSADSHKVNARKARAEAARKATQVPQNGSPRVPIILVNYSDVNFKDSNPKATFEAQFNTKDKSCYRYFVDQSRGNYTPQFDILGPVTLNHERAYYGSDVSSSDHDQNIGGMVAEAVKALTDTDFSVYDNNNDGAVDVVVIIYAGVGQATSGVEESIWPCQWSLSSAYYYGRSDCSSFRQNGKTIDKFAVLNELLGSRIDGVGTFCHEFSHCLGLPDYYETTYANGYFGMSYWSLMHSGCYLNNSDTPCGYSGYERNFMGWLSYTTPVENTQYTLAPINTDAGTAVKVTNNADRNEYYILENRQKTGWDAYLPSHGMMVNHITYNATVWNNNTVNNSSMQRMTIIPADAVLSSSTLSGDLYPNGGRNTSLTDNSSPAATVNTGSLMGKPITSITEKNSNITFWYMRGTYIKDIPEMQEVDDNSITTDGFTAVWNNVQNVSYFTVNVASAGRKTATYNTNINNGTDTVCVVSGLEEGGTYNVKVRVRYTDGTDSDWSEAVTVVLKEVPEAYPADNNTVSSDGFTATWKPLKNIETYTLKVTRADQPDYFLLLQEGFSKCTKNSTTNIGTQLNSYLDTQGWTGSRLYEATGGLRLGLTTSTSGGALRSPDLDLSDSEGKMTVIVTAAPYASATSTNLVITNGTSTQTLTVSGTQTFHLVLDCDITETGYLTFGSTSKKPVVLSNVTIYAGEYSDNANAPKRVTVKGDNLRMTISGITDTQYTITGLSAGKTYNYKVRGVTADGIEGEWSDIQTISLPVDHVTGDLTGDNNVDILDINVLIGLILNQSADQDLLNRADINADGSIDILDVNSLVNLILN